MSAARDFLLMANADPRVTDRQPRVTYEGQTTFTKLCVRCGFHTPHILIAGGSQCVICPPPVEDKNAIRPAETNRLGR